MRPYVPPEIDSKFAENFFDKELSGRDPHDLDVSTGECGERAELLLEAFDIRPIEGSEAAFFNAICELAIASPIRDVSVEVVPLAHLLPGLFIPGHGR